MCKGYPDPVETGSCDRSKVSLGYESLVMLSQRSREIVPHVLRECILVNSCLVVGPLSVFLVQCRRNERLYVA
jgi:hypothetical protein